MVVSPHFRNRAQEAKKYLSMLDDEHDSPCERFSSLKLFEQSCSDLNQRTRTLISIRLANCHLHKAGLQTYECVPGSWASGSNLVPAVGLVGAAGGKPRNAPHLTTDVDACVRRIGKDAVAYGDQICFVSLRVTCHRKSASRKSHNVLPHAHKTLL